MSRAICFYARGAMQASNACRTLANRLESHSINITLREVQQKYPH
jgi:hypothetical protein